MGWAQGYIDRLQQGQTVRFRPRGDSMRGKVDSGDQVTIRPVKENDDPKVGDVVLCKVHGNEYLHLVKAVKDLPAVKGVRRRRYQIGNNKGGTNGWVGIDKIYGICIQIQK